MRTDPTPPNNEGPISKTLVLGDGGWGTALAMVLHENGHDVRVWGVDAEYTRQVQSTRKNPKFLPGVVLPEGIVFGSDAAQLAEGVAMTFSVVPTQFLRSALTRIGSHLPPGTPIVSCSKGFERGSLRLPSGVISELLPAAEVVVLSGPSHAEEVSRGLPTTVVVATTRAENAAAVQRLLNCRRFRVYTSGDPVGVEVGGAAKNIIALAAGISDGLGFGDNTRAGLITRGLHEITRLGKALGARVETFAGLSGTGDLIVTCTSSQSRNYTVGFRIARGEGLEDIRRSTETVAEGVETTRSIHELARTLDVTLPITAEVHAVLFEGKSPRKAVEDLMCREVKEERR